MSKIEPLLGTFHDATSGETITRELTKDEIEALLATGWTMEAKDETPSPD
jgi:hypothetical protein